MTLQTDNIPAELRASKNWVCFMLLDNPEKGKPDKVPINPSSLWGARPNAPTTWGTFQDAAAQIGKTGRCKRPDPKDANQKITVSGAIAGVGYMFNNAGIVGVDFDHCIDPNTGELNPWAASWVERFGSYTEISPSGTGLHILCKGNLPGKAVKLPQAEMYDKGRYFTVTGNVFGECRGLTPAQESINALYTELTAKEQKRPATTAPPSSAGGVDCLLDFELVEKIHNSKHGRKFDPLWAGDVSGYKSGSEADLALCNILAFWTRRDTARMDALFRQSGLMRDKWDRPQSGSTYGSITVQKAADECTEVYDPATWREERARRDFSEASQLPGFAFINPIEPPSVMRRYTLDDMGTARLFADTFRGLLLYLPEYRDWFIYDSGRWIQDKGGLRAHNLAKELADYVWSIIPAPPPPEPDAQEKPEDKWSSHRKHYNRYRSLQARKTLIQDAMSELRGNASDFDHDPYLFNCQNGTLDLRTGKLRPHDPSDMISKQATVNYDPAARSPRFVQFIEEITESNTDRAAMLQKSLGYALKGEANEECYFTAIGEKTRNGKGTLFDTVLQLFGSYGIQMDFATISRGNTVKDGSKATPDLARLASVRFVLTNEPEKGVYLNEALMKQITGNDDITSRPLYGDILQFKPVFKLFITANSKPNVADDSLFASGRVKLLPFTRHFEEHEQDRTLKSKLREPESMSGILNWLLDGYRRYCAEGLKDTEEMQRMVGEYRWENDAVGQYLAERVTLTPGTPGNRMPVKRMLADYRHWCDPIGIKPLGLKMFKSELERHNVEVYNFKDRYPSLNAVLPNNYDYTG